MPPKPPDKAHSFKVSKQIKPVRWVCRLAAVLGAVGILAMPSLSRADATPRNADRDRTTQRWLVLDSAHYVGRIEWSCAAGRGRVRYVNAGPTERVAVRLGLIQALHARAWIQPHYGLELPLGSQVQRWRVKPISESLPPTVVFRVEPAGSRCAEPIVSHRALKPG
jgi:hypothetical protein